MISKVAKHEARHVIVALAVLLREDQHVATHGDGVHEKNVQASPHSLGEGGVGDGAHHERNGKMTTPHSHVGQLVVRGGVQNHVVAEDEDAPRTAGLHELFLLLQKLADHVLVPLGEEKPRIPILCQQVLQEGVAGCAAHEG